MGWLNSLLGRVPCEGCRTAGVAFNRAEEYHQALIEVLQAQIVDLKDQRDRMEAALFRAMRIPPGYEASAIQNSLEQAREGNKFTGSKRNWNDVRTELEKQHRKPTTEDQAKKDSWERVNERAAQEIPELARALAEKQVVADKTDVEILAGK